MQFKISDYEYLRVPNEVSSEIRHTGFNKKKRESLYIHIYILSMKSILEVTSNYENI